MSNIPFLDNLPEPETKPLYQSSASLNEFEYNVKKTLLNPFSPEYPTPEVFVADPISRNLDRYVKPNPVAKDIDAWLDYQWVWSYPEYKNVAGIPIRNRVIEIALMKKQPILCRVRRFKKYVFIIDPVFAQEFAEITKSYKKIYGSEFSIIPIVKFKKVLYS